MRSANAGWDEQRDRLAHAANMLRVCFVGSGKVFRRPKATVHDLEPNLLKAGSLKWSCSANWQRCSAAEYGARGPANHINAEYARRPNAQRSQRRASETMAQAAEDSCLEGAGCRPFQEHRGA